MRPFLADADSVDPVFAYARSPWLKFDDETVSICADSKQVLERNFGGGYEEVVQVLGTTVTRKDKSGASAYMLIYVREAMVKAHGFLPRAQQAAAPQPQQTAAAAEESKQAPTVNGQHPVSSAAGASATVLAAALSAVKHVPSPSLDSSPELTQRLSESKNDGGDADMLEPGAVAPAADKLPLVAAMPTMHRALSCFTADPTNMADFLASLQPVEVPLPAHMTSGLEEQRRKRAEMAEKARVLALQFPVHLLFERALVWQGFDGQDSRAGIVAPSGGVAGLDLTTAPATDPANPAPLPLRDFLFKRRAVKHVFQLTDTVSMIREQLAQQYGLPVDRLQLWLLKPPAKGLVEERRIHLESLHDRTRTLQTLDVDSAAGTPTLLLRDKMWLDEHPALTPLSHSAGIFKTDGEFRSLHPVTDPGTGTSSRRLLLFKWFDVTQQRMVHLGSAVHWMHMSVSELKQWTEALIKAQGIQLHLSLIHI